MILIGPGDWKTFLLFIVGGMLLLKMCGGNCPAPRSDSGGSGSRPASHITL